MAKGFLFAREARTATAEERPEVEKNRWKVLVVDDDREIHSVTELTLGKVRYRGRRLQLLSAFSAAEALQVLGEHPDIALILLDVVMETDDAGLQLARQIREVLGNRTVRIVLRTGQPGQAPERSVIVDYDINDYKAKTELTSQKLFTATIAALRSYADIVALEASRRGHKRIAAWSGELAAILEVDSYAREAIRMLARLLKPGTSGILVLADGGTTTVLAGAGRYEPLGKSLLDAAPVEASERDAVRAAEAAGEHLFSETSATLVAQIRPSGRIIAHVEPPDAIDELQRMLADMFFTKIAVGFSNVRLFEQVRSANELLEQRVIERTHRLNEEIIVRQRAEEEMRKAKELAEQAASAKASFLATMSHEIRTPMNGILGMLQLLRPTPLTEEQRDMLRIIQGSTEILLTVINDILDFSKIEAGRLQIESIEFDILDVVESVADLMAIGAQAREIALVTGVDPAIRTLYQGDPVRVRQVLTNLLSNAVKFTATGHVAVTARIESGGSERDVIRIAVEDTGIGVSEAALENLFKPFSQADTSTTRRFGGTGLGLVISKRLVELMGGEIGVTSAFGRGSTFWFRLPLRKAQAMQPLPGAEALAGLRILLVDSCGPRVDALRAEIEACGARFEAADSAAGAAAATQRAREAGAPVDVVLADMARTCAGPDAESALERARADGPLPVVALLPQYDRSAGVSGNGLPLAGVLPLPVRRSSLFQALALAAGRMQALPLPEAATALATYAAPSTDDAAAAGAIVLVAEDNRTNQIVISRQLAHLGFAHVVCHHGEEAWSYLRGNPGRVGLLITDCHMPELDGYALSRRVRARAREIGGHVPVVALTANVLHEEAQLCRAAGMDDVLTKPVELAVLDRVVKRWMPHGAKLRRTLSAAGSAPAPQAARPGRDEPGAPIDPAKGDPAPVDLDRLARQLGNGDPRFLRETLAFFWETMAGTPDELRRLVAAHDAGGLKSAAHAAKGAAGSAGAMPLHALLTDLQTAAAAADWTAIGALMPAVDGAFASLQGYIAAQATAA
ncbi:MAG: response regulator [Alphaproteobacteria bacterium]|nr:response regulator [Alphaproteobacteria bacterium]